MLLSTQSTFKTCLPFKNMTFMLTGFNLACLLTDENMDVKVNLTKCQQLSGSYFITKLIIIKISMLIMKNNLLHEN